MNNTSGVVANVLAVEAYEMSNTSGIYVKENVAFVMQHNLRNMSGMVANVLAVESIEMRTTNWMVAYALVVERLKVINITGMAANVLAVEKFEISTNGKEVYV